MVLGTLKTSFGEGTPGEEPRNQSIVIFPYNSHGLSVDIVLFFATRFDRLGN